MTTIYLVRHGQASFGSNDYDQLSTLGREQSRMLATRWSNLGICPDRVYAGWLLRQFETASAVVGSAGTDITRRPEFDEYPFHRVYEIAAQFSGIPGSGVTDWRQVGKQQFRDFLLALFDQGIDSRLAEAGLETWSDFRQRCYQGLVALLQSDGDGECIAVFSSAGVIGAIAQQLQGSSDAEAARQAFNLYNSAVTTLEFDGHDLTLLDFNQTDHLDQNRASECYTYL